MGVRRPSPVTDPVTDPVSGPAADPSAQPVGVVGLGEMGLPIAANLARAGFPVFAHDVDPLARNRAFARGINVAANLGEIAPRAPTWLVVTPSDALSKVVENLAAALSPSAVVVVCSSVDPGVMVAASRVLQASGTDVCEAALARGVAAAREGSLLLYCGGRADVLERVAPVLNTIGTDVVHVGPLGSGQAAKLLNNLLLWSNIAAVSETLRLAGAMGLDIDAVTAALARGSGRSWALDTWSRARPMPDVEHDLTRVLRTADELSLEFPFARAVQHVMTEVKARKAAWLAGAGVDRSMADFVRENFGSRSPRDGRKPR